MRFIQIRDLRPSEVWEQLADEREMVITARGKPVAILSSVSDANWAETLAAVRRVRAIQAVDELQTQSVVEIGLGDVRGWAGRTDNRQLTTDN